ncbi:hypothetical protein VJ923_10515 [Adlercreutzia sp. R25]|uniref:Uncharacterized protein n=1 Tax=Adlercreutzia shanghongiae TaxID=3111773 RepID=A0ABU6J1U4_9ACTN|nr:MULTISPECIES: hypothetical protein [unclassified Adlercreutzia]MEC4273592.1 hypothetical protein [Adlercreutzia sp. R25]MEC4295918.1 hypothetical protein [Adlercreutzia sp. R22]
MREAAQEKGWCLKASSITELAEVTGLTALPETVTEHDGFMATGSDPDFFKDPAFLQPIESDSRSGLSQSSGRIAARTMVNYLNEA